ncbi:MAG: hypothetical protein ACYTG0_33470 [Planctomycetota bacterium]|jgi:hypothetical protein
MSTTTTTTTERISENRLFVVRAARRVNGAYLEMCDVSKMLTTETPGDVTRKQRDFNAAMAGLIVAVKKLTDTEKELW